MAKSTEKVEIEIVAKDETKKGTTSANKNLESIGKSSIAVTAALTAAAAATTVVIAKAVNAYAVQEQAIFQLEQRIKSTGGAAGLTGKQLTSMAAGLQKVTTFGDEAIIEMQSLLLTFTQIAGPQFEHSTEAILNVATAMGTDLKSAALQVGKALNDPVGQMSALTRSGIQFTAEQKELIKTLVETNDVAGAQNVILAELDKQFGGAAEAARQGTGAIKAASNAVGDLWEAIGSRLSPAVVTLAGDVEQLAIRLAELISPSEETQINDEINTTRQRIDELTGAMLRAESATQQEGIGGWISSMVFGDSGTAQEAREEIARLETKLSELEGRLVTARGGEVAAPGEAKTEVTRDLSKKELEALQKKNREKFAIEIAEGNKIVDLFVTQEQAKQDAANRTFEVQQQLRDMDSAAAQQELERQKARDKQRLDSTVSLAASTMSLMGSMQEFRGRQSRKEFELNKALNIGLTVANTAAMAVAAGRDTPGPWYVRLAAVLAAVSTGVGQLNAIKSASFGGGSTSSPAPSFTPPSAPPGQEPIEQPVAEVPTEAQDRIKVIDATGLLGKILEEELIPAINEAKSRNVVLEIT